MTIPSAVHRYLRDCRVRGQHPSRVWRWLIWVARWERREGRDYVTTEWPLRGPARRHRARDALDALAAVLRASTEERLTE